jgi:hypothetical protein
MRDLLKQWPTLVLDLFQYGFYSRRDDAWSGDWSEWAFIDGCTQERLVGTRRLFHLLEAALHSCCIT